MVEEYYQLNLWKYFKAIYRQKWLVVLCLCSAIALSLLITKSRGPIYQAHVSFWIKGAEEGRDFQTEKVMRLFFIGQKGPFGANFATQIELIKSPLILQNAVRKIGLPAKTKKQLRDSIKLVRSSISVSQIVNTTILDVRAFHPSPEMVVKMSNAVCEAYIEFNNKLFLEQEERNLKSMEGQARQIREQMGKSNDLITERIKVDMYLLLMEKIAETRLNLSLGQSEQVRVIDKAEEAGLVPTRQTSKSFFMGIIGLFLGIVLALVIDNFTGRDKKKGA